jgi:hypothetical protein
MNVFSAWLWGLSAIIFHHAFMDTPKPSMSAGNPMDAKHAPIRALITASANKHGVPPSVALAFAWLESKFNPNARGDLTWHTWEGGKRFQENVLDNPKFANNPYKNQPELWHSYGLFQLLSPYFTKEMENPQVLYDPNINTERAMVKIANSLKAANGSVVHARLIYAGATKLNSQTQALLANRVNSAMKFFSSIG